MDATRQFTSISDGSQARKQLGKSPYSVALLEKTKRVWEPYAGHPISDEEARQIIENMTGLFEFLERLDRKDAQAQAQTHV